MCLTNRDVTNFVDILSQVPGQVWYESWGILPQTIAAAPRDIKASHTS